MLTLAKVKKKLWIVFSEYVRKRDGLRTTGSTDWALCITCQEKMYKRHKKWMDKILNEKKTQS